MAAELDDIQFFEDQIDIILNFDGTRYMAFDTSLCLIAYHCFIQ